jgi:hypothetical protein
MTDAEIDVMEAGHKMDSAVAEACGIPHRCTALSQVWVAARDPAWTGEPFSPSGEWSAAMTAAERFGLFDTRGHWASLVQFSPEGIWQIQNAECLRGVAGSAPTGPLAICRAILKLANKQ